MIPFDGERMEQTAQEFIDHELIERLDAQLGVGGRELPLRQPRARRRGAAGRADRVRDARGRDGRGRRRDHLLDAHPRADRHRPGRRRGAPARRAVRDARDRRSTATSAGARSASRPRTSCPTRRSPSPTTGSTPAGRSCRGMGEWAAAVSVGVRPTFVTGRGLLVEAFLLDFYGDLYGRELRLEFVERIRGEKRFESAESLIEQMHRDVARDRRLGLTTGRPFGLDRPLHRVRGHHAGAACPCPDPEAPPDRAGARGGRARGHGSR